MAQMQVFRINLLPWKVVDDTNVNQLRFDYICVYFSLYLLCCDKGFVSFSMNFKYLLGQLDVKSFEPTKVYHLN